MAQMSRIQSRYNYFHKKTFILTSLRLKIRPKKCKSCEFLANFCRGFFLLCRKSKSGSDSRLEKFWFLLKKIWNCRVASHLACSEVIEESLGDEGGVLDEAEDGDEHLHGVEGPRLQHALLTPAAHVPSLLHVLYKTKTFIRIITDLHIYSTVGSVSLCRYGQCVGSEKKISGSGSDFSGNSGSGYG